MNYIISKRNVNHNLSVYVVFLVMLSSNFPAMNGDTSVEETFIWKSLFTKYGTVDAMTLHGFEHLLDNIGLGHLLSKSILTSGGKKFDDSKDLAFHHSYLEIEADYNHFESNSTHNSSDRLHLGSRSIKSRCFPLSNLINTFSIDTKLGTLSTSEFSDLCPALIYELDTRSCRELKSEVLSHRIASHLVWVYASAAVLVISLSGLIVVAVIPIIRGAFYEILLQFLVALAVGSLIGDALLHLIPHALSEDEHHDCQNGHGHDHDNNNEDSSCLKASEHLDGMVWKGLVGVVGIFLFFIAEKLLTVCSTRRKNMLTPIPTEKLLDDDVEMKKAVGEKLCKHNKYDYCYGEVMMDMLKGLNECEDKDHHNCLEKASQTEQDVKDPIKLQLEEVKTLNPLRPKRGEGDHFDQIDLPINNGVIVTQHEHRHHGHSHTHTLAVPTSISSVAWMVIMGDGLHNFSDGLAIGAAFSNSVTGGVSTSIAVFCHELPHELGDFAVLLRSGMTAKQALAYNGLSSVLCFIGMLVGVALGNMMSISSWIFAGAAGMFVYIALVDMLPELNSTSTSTSSGARSSEIVQIFIQALGMALGVCIMLLIALYEHDLQRLFQDE